MYLSSSYRENDYEENDGSGRPVENSLGESHRKCPLQKRDIIRELKKRKIYHVCPQKGKKIFIHVHEITQIDD